MIGVSLGEAFGKSAAMWRDKVALQDDRASLTYRELDDASNALGNAFLALGIVPGDRVAMWMYNRVEYVVTELALVKIGAIRVPMNHLLGNDEASRRLGGSGAKLVVCGPEFIIRAQQVGEGLDSPVGLIGIGVEGGADIRSWSELVRTGAPGGPAIKVDPNSPAAIMFTGGTTGQSKGVVHTHNTIMATTLSCILEWGLRPEDVLLHLTPLPHGAGFMAFAGLVRGCRNVLMEKFNPESFLKTVERERATWTFLVPTMLYMILDSGLAPRHDIASLATILYGAAPMAPARVEEALRTFGPVLVQAYAQMEAINSATLLSKADHVEALKSAPHRLGSCGRAGIIPSVKVVRPDGTEAAAGEVGEIAIKSPHVMKGYWQNPEATGQALRDGWCHTGDLARRDEEGYFYIVDRSRDVIISGGMNIYSTTVEEVIFQHPAVASAAVFAVPDAKWGEAVRAHVVLREGMSADADLLIAHCRDHLARYEVPKHVEVVDALPMTPYGKVDKKALRKPFWGDVARNVS